MLLIKHQDFKNYAETAPSNSAIWDELVPQN